MLTSSKERIVVLEPGGHSAAYWSDMWNARELLLMLSKRDLMIRYRQAVMGWFWAILRPTLNVAVFTVVFGVLARLPSREGVPYPVLVLSGLIPWTLFSTLLGEMSNSLIGNAHMISKIYFPRLVAPLSVIPANIFDTAINLGLLLVLMLAYGFVPSWHVIFLPFAVGMVIIAATGAGLFFAAANVAYRDVRFIIPFVLSIGWLVSPVGFSSEIVPDRYQALYSLNPLVGVIEAFRWCILGEAADINWFAAGASFLASIGLIAFGLHFFRRTERVFADII